MVARLAAAPPHQRGVEQRRHCAAQDHHALPHTQASEIGRLLERLMRIEDAYGRLKR